MIIPRLGENRKEVNFVLLTSLFIYQLTAGK